MTAPALCAAYLSPERNTPVATDQDTPLDLVGHEEMRRLEQGLRTTDEIDDLILVADFERVRALAEQQGFCILTCEPWGDGRLRCRLKRSGRVLKSPAHPRLDSRH
jgi:hypothetical protein